MNVLIVAFSLCRTGGIEAVARETALALEQKGISVRCVGVHDSRGEAKKRGLPAMFDGCAPRNFLARSLWCRFPALLQGTYLRKAMRWADAVIFSHANLLAALPIGFSRPQSLPLICWIHGREAWGKCGDAMRPLLPRASHLVAVSKYTADSLATTAPRSTPLVVIHNPVDTTRFSPGEPTAIRRYSILTCGRHDDDTMHKGYDVLIRGVARVRQASGMPITLTITGDGPRRKDMIAVAAELGISQFVDFVGDVPPDQVIRLYRTHDVFALPSAVMEIDGYVYGEGFGVVNIEAASCGRPVITSTHGGCPETIVDGETGVLVDPTSDGSVTAAISKMFSLTAAERDAMGARGRAMVIERFSRDRFREHLANLIHSVT
jgi:phosphatidylinositol alpha-1,6-mannosyltransferase